MANPPINLNSLLFRSKKPIASSLSPASPSIPTAQNNNLRVSNHETRRTNRSKKGILSFMSRLFSKPLTISSPRDPVHLTHVGFNHSKGTFTGLPKQWQHLLGECEMDAVDNALTILNTDFSPWTYPAEWISANEQHINRTCKEILRSSDFDIVINGHKLYPVNLTVSWCFSQISDIYIFISQRFIIHLYVHLTQCECLERYVYLAYLTPLT
jgi:hypothetical protein